MAQQRRFVFLSNEFYKDYPHAFKRKGIRPLTWFLFLLRGTDRALARTE